MFGLKRISRPMLALGSTALVAGFIASAPAQAASSACSNSYKYNANNEPKENNGVSHAGGNAAYAKHCKKPARLLRSSHRPAHAKTKENDVSHGGGIAHHTSNTTSQ